MSLLVVGSVAYDNIITPRGRSDDTLGGSAVYFSLAAALFSEVRLVGVVGDDFDASHVEALRERGVDSRGLEVIGGGKTFRWTGQYSEDMNQRDTLDVQLNVFADFRPSVPEDFRDSAFVFLANAPPSTQLEVLEQMRAPRFVVADTMDLWIETCRGDLDRLLERLDGLVINDSEAMQLTGCSHLVDAGWRLLELGPDRVVVKKGEHGALLFGSEGAVPLPAYPTRRVEDPTGAGDSFAGAFMGSLTRDGEVGPASLKRAVARGIVAASFTVEGFGTSRLAGASREDLERRYVEYRSFLTL